MFGSSKKKSKDPRFFCENCNTEVPKDAKCCPKCGRYFESVRCPACGFIGEEALFKDGCPVCGYSSRGNALPGNNPRDFREEKNSAGALPVWVYILTAAAFTIVLAALFLKLVG